jgi:hypothetical protein
MGRKAIRTTTTNKGKTYQFVAKQIILKGRTLEMFDFERDDRAIAESALGSEIIYNHYKNNPPKGYVPKD